MKRIGMAFVLFVVVAGFYWKITLTRQYDWVWGFDLANQVLPWFQEQARVWGKGTIALWDPYLWGGQSLLGQAQPGAAYPLNWLLFALPLRGGALRWDAVQWYFVVIHLMAVAFCYWICRDWGRSRAASLTGAIVFGLGGFIGSAAWPQMVNGAVWLPLVFLFLMRALRGTNTVGNAALSGMFLGVAWLCGHHQIPMFLSLAAAGVWLFHIFKSGRPNWVWTRAAGVWLIIAAMTSALQLLPAYEYGRLAKRWAGTPEPLTWNQSVPYSVHETYDLKPTNLLGIVFPDIPAASSPFMGVTALALALLALALSWRDSRVRVVSAVGLGGLLYALGGHSVFQGFLYGAVPEVEKARVVSQAVVVFQFGFAVLAAFGVDQLGSSEHSPWPRRAMWTVLVFGVVSLAIFQAVFFWNKMSLPFSQALMLTPFFALGLAGLLFAVRRGTVSQRQAAVLVVLLVLFELGNKTQTYFAPRADRQSSRWLDQMRANQDVAEFLKKQPGFQRTSVANDAFSENWGAWHGVLMWQGDLASVTTNVLSLEFWRFPTHMLYGVAYTIAAAPPPDGGQEVFAGASGLKVYRHPEAFPRAWSVHELWQVRDIGEGNREIVEHYADLRRKAFLLTPPPAVETCDSSDGVQLEAYAANQVRIRARMACKGMVLVSDAYFPGWHATVDGNATPIYEVNQAMRGVVVPAGDHQVVFAYRPMPVFAGLFFTLAGVAGAIALALRGRSSTEISTPAEPVQARILI